MLEVVGSGKVELFDERSLRKLDEIPFENILLRGGLNFATWHARRAYTYPIENSWFNGSTFKYARDNGWDLRPSHVFNTIGLINDARVPAVDEAQMTVDLSGIIGWANKSTYSGTDTRRGTPNYTESSQDPTYMRWVFDWPTSSANGTFRSIMWYLAHASLFPQVDAETSRYLNPTNGWTVTAPAWMTYDAGSDFIYSGAFDGNGRIFRTAWGDGVSAPTSWSLRFRTGFIAHGMCQVGSELFAIDYNNPRVTVYPASTNIGDVTATPTRTLTYSSSASEGTICTDGSSLYLGWGSSTTVIKSNVSGTVLGTFTITGGVHGMLYDPTTDDLVIWNGTTTQRYGASGARFGVLQSTYYTLNFSSGFVIGSKMWVIQDSATTIYRYGLTSSFGLGARTRLPSDVTKTNLQTMKITYQFNYS